MAANEEEEEQQQTVEDTSVLETKGVYYAHQDQPTKIDQELSPEPAVDVLISDDMVIVENEEGDVSIMSDTIENLPNLLQSDPALIFELEKHAKTLGIKLEAMINGLHSNLDAMLTCTHQSVTLHQESVDSLHSSVDKSVKAMYSFLSQFNELYDNLKPIKELSKQIVRNEVNETLKTLEKL